MDIKFQINNDPVNVEMRNFFKNEENHNVPGVPAWLIEELKNGKGFQGY